jgi:hypothetical protein
MHVRLWDRGGLRSGLHLCWLEVPMMRGRANEAAFLVRSNFGRASGWIVELEGRSVGQLTNCTRAAMFWDSYSIAALRGMDASALWNDQLWNAWKFRFRNRESGECAAETQIVRRTRMVMSGYGSLTAGDDDYGR